MDSSSEQESLRELKERGICPNCGKLLQPQQKFPRGAGVFCSLECVAQYHEAEFSERAKKIATAGKN
jgi:hypothetical protein